MRAITLWNPWAWAMAVGAKTIETRSRPINYHGDICIHAGQYQPAVPRPIIDALEPYGWNGRDNLPKGAILAVVEIERVCRTLDIKDCDVGSTEKLLGDYTPGRFAYVTTNLRLLEIPVPCRGHQSLHWAVPPAVAHEVDIQLKKIPF